MQTVLRKCKKEDLKFLLNLKEKCFRWYIEKIYGWDDNVQVDLTKNEMAKNLKNMYIIQTKGKDIGLFTYSIDSNEDICIGMFAIIPKYQNRGIGRDILVKLIEANPDKRFYLKTYKENPARHLYERVGFTIYDQTTTHWLMEKVR